ncbi:MAG: 6,7-dimethyl-8-ribityllumazine synthase [Ignavibacteria bacterium]|jgi:6,7-dimethyl-8-ribityllumazine synthase
MSVKKISKKKLLRIAIAVSRYNSEVTEGLLKGACTVLEKKGISGKNITIVYCPGAFEIPLTAKKLCSAKKYDAVVCLGAVIKGETAHFEYISYAVTKGIMDLNLQSGIPVTFGVLTSYTEEQALKRSQPDAENKGAEAAETALEMIELLHNIG